MGKLTRIGLDISKSEFQLHGVDEADRGVLRKKLRRSQMLQYFAKLEPVRIGIEACGTAHYWARELKKLGHDAMLLPPQYVKPYVKRGKSDAADAEAICEAMSRPTMRFVPVKSEDQQAVKMMVGMRTGMVNRRTQIANTIRGYAAEFGLIAPKGLCKIEPLLKSIAEDEAVPVLAREQFAELGRCYLQADSDVKALDARLKLWQRGNSQSEKLREMSGIGPVGAVLLILSTVDHHGFGSPRDFAAWIGLTPRNHSTAGKTRLGKITRAGDELLRSTLVVGATSIIQQIKRGKRRASPWLADLMNRKPPKLVAVALANKMARVAFKLLTTGERFDPAIFEGRIKAPAVKTAA